MRLTTPDPRQGHMDFLGVSTSGSSIMKIFPQWARALGLPTATLKGHDIALGASRDAYRAAVEGIRCDPLDHGALVTTHKIAIYENAADLFDHLDESAHLFQEISSIAKHGGRLSGAAKDPITVQLALDEIVAGDHFEQTGGAAIVLGAGGAGNALSYQLGTRKDAPSRIIVTALGEPALQHAQALHERAGIDPGLVSYELTSTSPESDALIGSLPAGSLIVNATGMGKDRPGSPASDAVAFPERGIVWDFNYRGDLGFLAQARAQEQRRSLRIEDGWRYFIHGWTQVIADVFTIPMPPERVDELSRIASRLRQGA
jgi:shikimate dehydrogenase